MSEFVLLIWLLVPGSLIADPIEAGTYRLQARCEAARDSIQPAAGVTFIARCIERDK